MERSSRIKDRDEGLVVGKDEIQRICVIWIHEQVAVHKCGFNSLQMVNYLRGELIRRTEIEVSGKGCR